ncbi:MAG: dienelactone hydrolase, partial [Alphaproteobacteria bacterium]|nr:dienelactone hydrolase [Alphaproteobacteria bacterium]
GEIVAGRTVVPGVKDCPIRGSKLPLVVISHGRAGSFLSHHDTAAALADSGFVVAAINHPGDSVRDPSRSADSSVFVTRPTDIRRLIDFMLTGSPAAAVIDRDRIGFFGFSRGGYTGLLTAGATFDWAAAVENCQGVTRPVCEQILRKEFPAPVPMHDARIKAAVIADPPTLVFSKSSYTDVKIPLQLWASARGGDGVFPQYVAELDKDLPAPHEYRVVANSAHFAFIAPCPPEMAAAVPEICVDAAGFDRVAFHKELNAAMLAFFAKHL